MRIFILAIILMFSINTFSQNSLLVEIEYLKLIKAQNNIELAFDNYRNAELVADSVIFKQSNNKKVSDFFIELAKSYALNKDYENQALSVLRQQFLFADKSKNIIAKDLFLDACFKLNITKESALEIYKLQEKYRPIFDCIYI